MQCTLSPAGVARRLCLALLASGLIGCAHQPQPLYYWGKYQPTVFAHLMREQGPQQQLQTLEAEVEKARSKNQALPPGFRAHLGLLYAQEGKLDKTRDLLMAEKAAFPESSTFMDFLLRRFSP